MSLIPALVQELLKIFVEEWALKASPPGWNKVNYINLFLASNLNDVINTYSGVLWQGLSPCLLKVHITPLKITYKKFPESDLAFPYN